jgi:CheY-like chemotaxis protein
MAEPLRLLVVDAALDQAQMVVELVRSGEAWAAADTRIALSYDEALEAFRAHPFDVAVVDDRLVAKDGLSLLREIRRRGILTPVIVLTNQRAGIVAADAMEAGAADQLAKAHLTPDALRRTIRHALALHDEARQRGHADAALRASEERVRALEEQLQQAQTMETVGPPVRVVAHDLNNILTAMLGYCDLMLGQILDEDPLRQDLLEVQSAGERAAALTRQLLAFSSRQMTQPPVPDIDLPPSGSPTVAQPAASAADLAPGWETVLLVEDEDAVRALACAVLRRRGYVVLEARDGVDALSVAERHRDDIHLMVTDIVMPHMRGRELAERLGTVRPKMKMLFMSGNVDHVPKHGELPPGAAFLPKPFTPEVFARRVRSILDTTGG